MAVKKISPGNPATKQPETDHYDSNTTTDGKAATSSGKLRKSARKAARKANSFMGWSDRGLKGNAVAVEW